MRKILNYENSLYDEALENWRDVRGGTMENTIDSVSWCHGAGGILLSRVYCYEKIQNEEIRKYWKEILFDHIRSCGEVEDVKAGFFVMEFVVIHGF